VMCVTFGLNGAYFNALPVCNW